MSQIFMSQSPPIPNVAQMPSFAATKFSSFASLTSHLALKHLRLQ